MDLTVNLDKRKKAIRKIYMIFAGLIAVLTFFSNTINNLFLPQVETVSITEGRIINRIEAAGLVEPINMEKVYSSSSCSIVSIDAEPNQYVKAGSVLARVDQTERKKEIDLKSHELENLTNEMEKLKNNYDIYRQEALNDLKQLETEMILLKERMNQSKELYEAGLESKSDFQNAERDYMNASLNYNELLKILEYRKKEFDLECSKMQSNIELSKSGLQDLKESLYSNDEIICRFDGVVKSVFVEKGSRITEGQPLFEIIPDSDTTAVKWVLSADKAKLADINDPVLFEADSPEKIKIEGKIDKKEFLIDKNEYQYTSLISMEQAEQKSGLKINVTVIKNSNVYNMIVPNSAIIKSSGLEYIYVLTETDGPLGEEKYAQRVRVTVEDSDAFNSAINAVLDSGSRVVSFSSKPLTTDKIQVRLR